MEQEFIPYEEALDLKELGFDEPCLFAYNQDDDNKLMTAPQLSFYAINTGKNSDIVKNKVTTPFYQQSFRWFREKYGLCSSFTMNITCGWRICILPKCDIHISSKFEKELYPKTYQKNTYEEAELACLRKLIEIVKKK